MYNILIASHGLIANGFYDTAKMIIGEIEGVRAIGIQQGENIQEFEEKLVKLADELYKDDGLLVLTDLFGGTPSNITIMKLLNRYKHIELICGINLPILLEALEKRSMALENVKDSLINTGKNGIVNIDKLAMQSMRYHDDE